MGAWGKHMFENDADQDSLSELAFVFGVSTLVAPGSIPPGPGLRIPETSPTQAKRLRVLLNKGNKFLTVFKSMYTNLDVELPMVAFREVRGALVLLGALSIELGVDIDDTVRKILTDLLHQRLHMHTEAKLDMIRALGLYENGKPLRLYGLAEHQYPRNPDGTKFDYLLKPEGYNITDVFMPILGEDDIEIVWNECGGCHKKDNLKTCSRCGLAQFCGEECQRNVWKKHKPWCRAPKTKVRPPPVTEGIKSHFYMNQDQTTHPHYDVDTRLLTQMDEGMGQVFVQLITGPEIPKSKWRYFGRSGRIGSPKGAPPREKVNSKSKEDLAKNKMFPLLMESLTAALMGIGGPMGKLADESKEKVVAQEAANKSKKK